MAISSPLFTDLAPSSVEEMISSTCLIGKGVISPVRGSQMIFFNGPPYCLSKASRTALTVAGWPTSTSTAPAPNMSLTTVNPLTLTFAMTVPYLLTDSSHACAIYLASESRGLTGAPSISFQEMASEMQKRTHTGSPKQ